MKPRITVLTALLVPGLAMLAACDKNKGMDEEGTPPAAAAPADTTAPADNSMPADTTPASTTPAPADNMQGDAMSSSSDSGMTGGDKTFAEMDKNHDGSVTKDELDPSDMLYQHFSVADANGDGKLSEDEIAKHRADMAANPAK